MTSQAETAGIRVSVEPAFISERSNAEKGLFFWAYTVEITNLDHEEVQLLSRHWVIVDGEGHTEEVRGAGVVGEQPVLRRGETFRYTSGCPLATPDGSMRGSYTMLDAAGQTFDVAIPLFALISPFMRRTLH